METIENQLDKIEKATLMSIKLNRGEKDSAKYNKRKKWKMSDTEA